MVMSTTSLKKLTGGNTKIDRDENQEAASRAAFIWEPQIKKLGRSHHLVSQGKKLLT